MRTESLFGEHFIHSLLILRQWKLSFIGNFNCFTKRAAVILLYHSIVINIFISKNVKYVNANQNIFIFILYFTFVLYNKAKYCRWYIIYSLKKETFSSIFKYCHILFIHRNIHRFMCVCALCVDRTWVDTLTWHE